MCPDRLHDPFPYGLTGYGAYLPRPRLTYDAVAAALGSDGAPGARVVASYDEDTTTMGIEAARAAIRQGDRPARIAFATTQPAYLDKTNACAIHAALNLGHEGQAVDMAGAPRSSVGAVLAASAAGGLAIAADLRTGLPGSADERDGADAAAALLFGARDEALAEVIGTASATAEFLDRWRVPGEQASRQWEERFGLASYRPLVLATVARALERAGVDEPGHVIVSSPSQRTAKTLGRELAGRATASVPALGYAGAADPWVRLCAVLDRAAPGETVLVVVAADGCDAILLRVTDRIASHRSRRPVAAQLDDGRPIGYATYLTWRGLLDREPPRRPQPARPAGPPSARTEAWKFAFVGSRCRACGQVHLPPRRVCVGCGAVDHMDAAPLADRPGTVATFTVDRLAYSPAPPVIDAVVDFDGGGRHTLEVTDAGLADVAVGSRLDLTFRRLYTVDGVHNYFWKARPLVNGEGQEA
jgi:hydroxymethylglutaryl-CoA synthase